VSAWRFRRPTSGPEPQHLTEPCAGTDPASVRRWWPVTASRHGPRRASVALLVSAGALITACASPVTVSGAVDQAETALAERLAQAHERALRERAADPTAIDAVAADRLAYAITGGNEAYVVSATVTPDGMEVVTTVGVRAHVGGGMSYDEATLGACLRTQATAGSLTGDVGERGTVSTEAVPCPDDVVPVAASAPVDATTTELQGLRGPVPRPRAAPCFSGSGDCVGG
jgi:hypothetical protein